LRGFFRPEFLNRIDDVVIFDRLSKDDLGGIVDIQLRGLSRLLSERRLGISVTPEAKRRLVDLGYDPAFGARPLKRVILKRLQDPLAQSVLEAKFTAGDTIEVVLEGDEFAFGKKATPS
ncbi:MAG: chaperone protein ClpB, partial [Deltaproteobacteria bacterium]|nr:chaperone protein ClpB [Deltaproteobacteria bacterium]